MPQRRWWGCRDPEKLWWDEGWRDVNSIAWPGCRVFSRNNFLSKARKFCVELNLLCTVGRDQMTCWNCSRGFLLIREVWSVFRGTAVTALKNLWQYNMNSKIAGVSEQKRTFISSNVTLYLLKSLFYASMWVQIAFYYTKTRETRHLVTLLLSNDVVYIVVLNLPPLVHLVCVGTSDCEVSRLYLHWKEAGEGI